MAEFQTPQLAQARISGAKIAQAPTVDSAAHQRARAISANLDAINNLGMQTVKAVDQFQQAKYENQARRDTVGLPSYIDSTMRKRLAEEGKSFRDLSDEELDVYTQEAASSFYTERGLVGKPQYESAKRIGDDLSFRTLQGLTKKRDQENLEYNSRLIAERTNFQAENTDKGMMSPSDLVASLSSDLENDTNAVGPVSETRKAAGELGDPMVAKQSQLAGLIQYATTNGSPEVVASLKSSEAREYFKDVPEYKNMVAMAENKSAAKVSFRKGQNFNAIEEAAYSVLDAGGFTSASDVDSFMKEYQAQYKNSLYSPDAKDMFTLKTKLLKGAVTGNSLQQYRKALNAGDYTWLKSSGLKKDEQEELITKNAQFEVGVTDFSPKTIDAMLVDKEKKTSFVQYVRSGKPIPEQLRVWADETPVGGWEGMQRKYNAYQELAGVTEGRINDIFSKKATAEMLFVGNLVDNQGLSDVEKAEAFTAFKNDLNKNVDSYGNYYTPSATAFLQDKDVQKDIMNFAKDAPWTWDDNADSAYIARQVKGNTSLFTGAGYTPEESLGKAKDLFEKTHRYIELPNGEEGILTPKFLQVGADKEDMNKFVMNMAVVKRLRKAAFFSNNSVGQYLFDSEIAYRPTPDHEKTGEYHVFYKGKPLPNSRFNATEFRDEISRLNKKERESIIENRPNNK